MLVGVGIATSVETAAVLLRKAILRPIGTRHPNPKAAELELRLEEGLNRLGIGPQGLTGNSSVMGVHIESAARHPSTIGVVRRDFRPDFPGAVDRHRAVVDARRFAVNPLGRHDVAPFFRFYAAGSSASGQRGRTVTPRSAVTPALNRTIPA